MNKIKRLVTTQNQFGETISERIFVGTEKQLHRFAYDAMSADKCSRYKLAAL